MQIWGTKRIVWSELFWDVDIRSVLKSVEVPEDFTYGCVEVYLCRTPYMYFISSLSQKFETITGKKLYLIRLIIYTVK